MGFEVQGRIHKIDEVQEISERFRKRGFVLELDADGKYPQTCLFEFTGDRCEVLDQFSVGQNVSLEFSLRGREWTSPQDEVRYFNTLSAWKMELDGEQAAPAAGPDVGDGDDGGGL